MLRSITKDQFDLVHMHNIHSGWLSMKAMKEFTEHFPCVWTLHDEWAPNRGLTYDLTGKKTAWEMKKLTHGPLRYIPYHRYHENFKWRRTRKFLDQWMPQPKAVICPSAYMAAKARTSGVFPNSKIFTIPNGTSMPGVSSARMDRSEARESFGLPAGSPTVLMVAADLGNAHKGMDLAIRALKRVDPGLRFQVLLLGRSARQIQEALKPLPSVGTFAQDDITLARAYLAADLTIIPSLGENFPYVALESLACGTPLVAFPIGGMPEIIGKNERGILCSAIDTEEMARHISELLLDGQLRSAMGDRGAQWVRKTAAMPDYLKKIVELYSQVVSEM
jgi:glycosyltransferase involved in cell wall biosynthesis